jgi:hypothetical protein
VKKEFQQMIYDNVVAIEEIERVMASSGGLNRENDNVNFGLGVLGVVMEDVQRYPPSHSGSSTGTPSTSTRTRWKNRRSRK